MWMSCPQACITGTSSPEGLFARTLLQHRQRIHIAAHQNGRAGAVLHDGHDAVARRPRFGVLADRIRDLVAELAQARRHQRGGVLLLHRQFRRGVELLVGRDQRGDLAVDHLIERRLGDGGRGDEKSEEGDSLHGVIMRLCRVVCAPRVVCGVAAW